MRKARQCSGFICKIDGKTWVGRNNDWRVPEVWGHVTVREVEGRIPTSSYGMEGDVFTGTGYNKEKLWLHLHYVPTVDKPRLSRQHLICYIYLTEALETCASIADLEDMLSRIDRDDSTMLFAVDGKTNEGAIFECTCQTYAKRELIDGYLVGTNHYFTRQNAEINADSLTRYNSVDEMLTSLPTDNVDIPRDLIAILADDKVEQREGDWETVYSNVACPRSGEMWYTFGGHPSASKGSWQRFDSPW
ncbi:MAG: hypothetical protein HN929_06085 [Chloroflexi bacterium]|nr:hypothetical protein [Chloroflexota bacterium]